MGVPKCEFLPVLSVLAYVMHSVSCLLYTLVKLQTILSATASSMFPLYTSYSPSELLDRHLDASVRLHATQVESSTSAGSKHGAVTQSTTSDVVRQELSLLHAELMFERQRREVHARRGRRLLAHIGHLNSLADQNEAMVGLGHLAVIYVTLVISTHWPIRIKPW